MVKRRKIDILWSLAEWNLQIPLETIIYWFFYVLPTNNRFLCVFLRFRQVLTQYDVIWHHNWRHLTSIYVKITGKTQKTDIFMPQRPQYIDFDRLNSLTKQFFWVFIFFQFKQVLTQYDVIWRHNCRHLTSFYVKITKKHKIRRFYCPKDHNISILTVYTHK